MKRLNFLSLLLMFLPFAAIHSVGFVSNQDFEDFTLIDLDDVSRALFRCGIIYEEEFEKNSVADARNSFVTISLGCNCHPAFFARLHGIRFFASPFDWCVTPYAAIYHFIKNDFKNYLKRENLVVPSEQLYFPDYVQELISDLKHISRNDYTGWLLGSVDFSS